MLPVAAAAAEAASPLPLWLSAGFGLAIGDLETPSCDEIEEGFELAADDEVFGSLKMVVGMFLRGGGMWRREGGKEEEEEEGEGVDEGGGRRASAWAWT